MPAAVLLAVLGSVLATYWPALSAGALYMDDKYYVGTALMRQPSWASVRTIFGEVLAPSTVNGYYQPLSTLSVMLDFLDPQAASSLLPFHRTTLLLHLLNVALIMVLLRVLFGNWVTSGLLALLYGVHPLNADSVLWIAERKTVLSTSFALGSLVLYVAYARQVSLTGRRDWKRYTAALLLYACALLSKPTALPLLAWLLVLDYWPLQRLDRKALLEKVPFLIVGVSLATVAVLSQAHSGQAGAMQVMKPQYLLLVIGYCVAFYLLKTIYPANLVSDYLSPQPLAWTNGEMLVSVLGTAVAATAIVLSLRRTRAWLAGGLLFFVGILPTLGIIRYTASIAANRSMYLPMVGLLLPLAWGLGRLWNLDGVRLKAWSVRTMASWVGAVLVILSIGATRSYAAHWHDTLTLLRYYLTQSPKDAKLHTRLGNEWVRRGEHKLASNSFREAIRLNPTWTENHLNLGRALFTVGELGEAREAFASALEQTPKDWRAHMLLGMTLARQRSLEDALLRFREAARLAPTRAEPHYEMGNILTQLGRTDEAMGEYTTAVRLNPGFEAAKRALP